jgi:glycosyltransferase involved in cell wall biosynthesis
LPCSAATSYELMNAGARAASADIVVFIDADCVPCREWIRSLVETLNRNPNATGVSGLTSYAGSTATERVMGLLARSYMNPGGSGPTRYFSNNNGGMRREVWLRHPLPTHAGPYASRLQTEAIWREGGRFLFEPRMRVIHDYEGWRMELDIRRNHGYSSVITRLLDPAIPHAWLVRLGYLGIPLIVAGKTFNNWRDCLRCARYYGVRWYEIPFALALSAGLHLLEIPEMVQAFRGGTLTTAYR